MNNRQAQALLEPEGLNLVIATAQVAAHPQIAVPLVTYISLVKAVQLISDSVEYHREGIL